MRPVTMIVASVLIACLSSLCFAQEEKKPETVVGKMSTKLVRGVANVATSVVELPKQTYLTIRDDGPVGVVTGPLKGIGMTVYRVFIGAVETAFFVVPEPGYYEPMIEPPYVWEGWEAPKTQTSVVSGDFQEAPSQEQSSEEQRD